MLELGDYCHLQDLFWKTTVTVITVIVRIGRLLSLTRTLLEDHCHCQLQGLLCQNKKTTVIYKNSFGRPLSLSLSTSGTLMLELEDYCHLQKLFLKTTVTVIVSCRDSYVRIEDNCQQQGQRQGLSS